MDQDIQKKPINEPNFSYQSYKPVAEPKPRSVDQPKHSANLALPKQKSTLWVIVFVVVLIVVALGGYLLYRQQDTRYKNAQAEIQRLSNPGEAAKLEQQQLISQVGQLVELPQGQTPTIATVLDANKLKKQKFFANAKNGDKVLIYTEAKKAFLYRPSMIYQLLSKMMPA